MIIGIDARFAVGQRRGVGNYTLNLVRYLADDDDNRYILYTDKEDTENVLPRKHNFQTKKLPAISYPIWEQILLPLQAKQDGIRLLHCTANTAPLVLSPSIKLISTIHDISYLKPYSVMPRSPFLYQRLGRLYRRNIVPRSIRRAASIITVSKFAKKDILAHISTLSEEMISITYEAMNNAFRVIDKEQAISFVKKKYGITGQYILNVGGRDPQKNTAFLVRNFLELKRERKITAKMVIVGFPDHGKADIYKDLKNSGLKSEVVFIGFAGENDLVHLYNSAEAFVFPSLYESFGIPPLEAMACGTPVIASQAGAIPEIVGDAALTIDPQNSDELKTSIVKLLKNKNLKNYLIDKGFKQAKKYSWEKMAKYTLDRYRKVYGEIK